MTQPAFTPPDDFALGGDPLPEEIILEWDMTGYCKATVPRDQIREAFGLGGTPDSDICWAVATLASASPSMLRRLGAHLDDMQIVPVKLRTINGVAPGEL